MGTCTSSNCATAHEKATLRIAKRQKLMHELEVDKLKQVGIAVHTVVAGEMIKEDSIRKDFHSVVGTPVYLRRDLQQGQVLPPHECMAREHRRKLSHFLADMEATPSKLQVQVCSARGDGSLPEGSLSL
mmetsp:Transcript_10024/g.22498  ORF Transcript_10024/g.22498 Transcript_10024/m.22498 type:complete len:129 (+) Transcript_10024:230-616(+)